MVAEDFSVGGGGSKFFVSGFLTAEEPGTTMGFVAVDCINFGFILVFFLQK